jgi:hypothetical protein
MNKFNLILYFIIIIKFFLASGGIPIKKSFQILKLRLKLKLKIKLKNLEKALDAPSTLLLLLPCY